MKTSEKYFGLAVGP